MHEAYTIYPPIKIAANLQIESITGYDNNVILGTRQGHLLMYSLQPHSTENKMDLQLLQYDKNFSKKPIVQLQVLPDCNLLFSLSDNIVNVNDIRCHNFPLIHSASKTKGANVFALDVKRTTSLTGEVSCAVRLVVAVKRRLQFWYWKHDKLLEFGQDIELNDIPKVLAWSGNLICVGYKTEYVMFDLSDVKRKKVDLFPTSSSRTIDPCIALFDNDKYFGVVKDEYLITIASTKSDPSSPQSKTKPDISGVGSSSGNLANMIQSSSILDLKNNKAYPTIAWKEPLQMLVFDEPYIIGLVTDSVEIRVFDTSGFEKNNLIQTIPELSKARFLIRGKRGLLYAASINHLWCIQEIEIGQQRQALLQDKKFHLALQLTNMSEESEEDKKDTIHQIQTLYAFDLFINKKFPEAMKEFTNLKTDPCDVIRLFPDLMPSFENINKKSHSQMSSSMSGAELLSSLPKLTDKDLENGYLALIEYLVDIRYSQDKVKDKKSSATLLSIIDTTLLKCYLETNDSFVASLIRLNNCHLEESERILKSYKKYGELIILYQTKGQHKRALQLLKSQANVPGSSLYGFNRSIQYLQHLGSENKHLIFEFADWILESHPDEGLKIFTEDVQEVESLPRAEVLDYLLKNHKSLVVPYLEHIIDVWKESKAIFHNILIQQYRDQIFEYKSEIDIGTNQQKQLLLQNTKDKLIQFLKTSNKYHADKVLVDFPYNDLFEERAIVLGKLGKHEKVLAIYFQILGDIDKAIEYCDNVYVNSNLKFHEVYIILIKTFLNPPTTPPYSDVKLHPRCLEPDVDSVLDVLEKYASRINPCSVLPILPDNIPITRLKTFLEVSLHHQLEQKRKTQILKGLHYSENLQVQEQKMHLEAKNFLITESSSCFVCKKKFSNQSAFVRLSTGDIIHISCQERLSNT